MLSIRRSDERGLADHGWLKSRHTFSFADYHDPRYMGFRALRVINEDQIAGGGGFPPHSHSDMEIISYVLDGAIAHKDSMGTGSEIRPGDVQRMSAGTGVTHSEFNASKSEAAHFLQIWIVPSRRGFAPSYEQKHFSADEKRGRLRLVASPDGADGSVRLNQDARVYATLLAQGQAVTHALAAQRYAYVHVVRGKVQLGDAQLDPGDAARLEGETSLSLIGSSDEAEVLLFDLP